MADEKTRDVEDSKLCHDKREEVEEGRKNMIEMAYMISFYIYLPNSYSPKCFLAEFDCRSNRILQNTWTGFLSPIKHNLMFICLFTPPTIRNPAGKNI